MDRSDKPDPNMPSQENALPNMTGTITQFLGISEKKELSVAEKDTQNQKPQNVAAAPGTSTNSSAINDIHSSVSKSPVKSEPAKEEPVQRKTGETMEAPYTPAETLRHGATELKDKVVSIVHQVENVSLSAGHKAAEVADHVMEKVVEAVHHTDEENNPDLGPYEVPGTSGMSEFDPISPALAQQMGSELTHNHAEEKGSDDNTANNEE